MLCLWFGVGPSATGSMSLSLPGDRMPLGKKDGALCELWWLCERGLRACPQALARCLDRLHRLPLTGAAPSVLSRFHQDGPWGLLWTIHGGGGTMCVHQGRNFRSQHLVCHDCVLVSAVMTDSVPAGQRPLPQPGTWSKAGGAKRQLTGVASMLGLLLTSAPGGRAPV